jgi:hypothetical protein
VDEVKTGQLRMDRIFGLYMVGKKVNGEFNILWKYTGYKQIKDQQVFTFSPHTLSLDKLVVDEVTLLEKIIYDIL